MLKCLRGGSITNLSILQKFRMSSNSSLFTSHYLTGSIFSILHHSTMANGDGVVLGSIVLETELWNFKVYMLLNIEGIL